MKDALNQSLKLYVKLYHIAQWYHWNVVSPSFKELHVFFSDIYEQAQDNADLVAERLKALQLDIDPESIHFMPSDFPELIKAEDDNTMLYNLLGLVESSVQQGNKVMGLAGTDYGTQNMFGQLIENDMKLAWMLRSYL